MLNEVKHLNNTIKGDPSLRSGWQNRFYCLADLVFPSRICSISPLRGLQCCYWIFFYEYLTPTGLQNHV